jgi:hypothetical protein
MTTEQLKRAGEVMIAAAQKKPLQLKGKDDTEWSDSEGGEHLEWNWNGFDYRIKPTKTLRPWKPEEVPVGAQLKQGGTRWLIVGADSSGMVRFSTEGNLHTSKLSGYTHSADGGKTWHPCGVEVDS